jgi:hypothetical protein
MTLCSSSTQQMGDLAGCGSLTMAFDFLLSAVSALVRVCCACVCWLRASCHDIGHAFKGLMLWLCPLYLFSLVVEESSVKRWIAAMTSQVDVSWLA